MKKAFNKQGYLSVEGKQETQTRFFCSCDLDLDPMTWPGYSEDVFAYEKWSFRSRHSNFRAPSRTHRHLFCSCDLDLDPITLIYEHDGTILKRYRQTKELSRPKLEHYKQTIHRQSQMRPKAFTMPHSRVVTTAATCAQPDLARLGFDHRTIRCRACRCPMLLCI